VYDFAEENGGAFLVMEYAPNGSLAYLVQRAAAQNKLLGFEAVVKLLRDTAAGLATIHERGGVHRDLKPANILDDQQTHAKVADLGLV
jgi:serine/threonine-protein kinase